MSLDPTAVTTYAIAAAIDFRSGAPVALAGSQSPTVGSNAVTNGVFDGSTSWAQLSGLTLGAVAAITAVVNVPAQNGQMLWEYGPLGGGTPGSFYTYGVTATELRMLAQGTGSYTYIGPTANLAAAGQCVLNTQYDISVSPFLIEACINGGTPLTDTPSADLTGTYGAKTLNIGARDASSLFMGGTIDFLIVHDAWQSDALKTALAADVYAVLSAGGVPSYPPLRAFPRSILNF